MSKLVSIVFLALSLFLAGCVSTANVAVSNARLAQVSGGRVVTTSRPLADFAAMKASNAMLSGMGAAAALKSGNDLLRKNGVEDPAQVIAGALANDLAKSHRLVRGQTIAFPGQLRDAKRIGAAAAGRADLVVDVQTINWMCIYLPFNWARFRVLYSAKLRLIDVRRNEQIAEGFFAWQTPDDAEVSYDQLFENQAAGLKAQLAQAAAAATAHFREKVFAARN